MTAKQQLESLLALFERSRRSGCTTAMLKGAADRECIVVTHNYESSLSMQDRLGSGIAVSLQRFNEMVFFENSEPMPVVLDNATTMQILRLAICEITIQENRVAKAKRIAREIDSV